MTAQLSQYEHLSSSPVNYDSGWDSLDDDDYGQRTPPFEIRNNDGFDTTTVNGFMFREIESLAQTEENRRIIGDGVLEGRDIGSEHVRRSVHDVFEERLLIARLVAAGGESEHLARTIAREGICGFHGTEPSALAGIIEAEGLRSAVETTKQGGYMVTGEHTFQPEGGQGSTSFSNLKDSIRTMKVYAGEPEIERFSLDEAVRRRHEEAAEIRVQLAETSDAYRNSASGRQLAGVAERLEGVATYVQEHPESLIAALERTRFPVVFGVTNKFVAEVESGKKDGSPHMLTGVSDFGEFRLDANVPLSELPLVLVPSGAVNFVRRLFEMHGITDVQVQKLESLYAGERLP